MDALEIVPPLEPRDAFYGGRTEAFKLYKEASDTVAFSRALTISIVVLTHLIIGFNDFRIGSLSQNL